MRYEVRCCCNPERLYGWIERSAVLAGGKARYVIATGYEWLRVELEDAELCVPDPDSFPEYRRYRALKYADESITPAEKLERLKGIRGFEANPRAVAELTDYESIAQRRLNCTPADFGDL